MKYKKDDQGRAIITDAQAQELYLKYTNDYLTINKLAEDYDLDPTDAYNIVQRGLYVNERIFKERKKANALIR